MHIKTSFSKKLLDWHAINPRDLPWKETRDPYKTWLSEIILQQTKVEQGTPYYEKLVRLFPTVHHLADATEDEVMKAWQGLGYYTRARNLHQASKQIVNEFGGIFPSRHDQILKLKGVGSYTAAAIASFAFDQPHAVMDGNVFRVLARTFGIDKPIDSIEGKKIFRNLAEDLLDKKNPAAYNQAIMNFGSAICTPANPLCHICCFRKACYAFNHQMISQLPRKEKKISVRSRWFNFLFLEDRDDIIIEKRTGKDIWKSLFQFPMIETTGFADASDAMENSPYKKVFSAIDLKITGVSPIIEHRLTHQKIMAQFIHFSLPHEKIKLPLQWKIVKKSEIENFGFPKLIADYCKKFIH
ncbi:MAG: A/G-specific adenine glycosylase [Chitinophagales bacterium]